MHHIDLIVRSALHTCKEDYATITNCAWTCNQCINLRTTTPSLTVIGVQGSWCPSDWGLETTVEQVETPGSTDQPAELLPEESHTKVSHNNGRPTCTKSGHKPRAAQSYPVH